MDRIWKRLTLCRLRFRCPAAHPIRRVRCSCRVQDREHGSDAEGTGRRVRVLSDRSVGACCLKWKGQQSVLDLLPRLSKCQQLGLALGLGGLAWRSGLAFWSSVLTGRSGWAIWPSGSAERFDWAFRPS
eukprot:1066063-Pleurochrysis_carterae.AAC.1